MTQLPFQFNVGSFYGAPMGRRSDTPSAMSGKVSLRRVPLVDGDYDQGGAYWGGGRFSLPLFCAWNYDAEGEIKVCYFRARDRNAAKAMLPGCRFYR